MNRVQNFVGNVTNGSVNFGDGEVWKNGIVLEGNRKGSTVVVAPINRDGFHQVIFATGASGWYLPEDLKIKEEGL